MEARVQALKNDFYDAQRNYNEGLVDIHLWRRDFEMDPENYLYEMNYSSSLSRLRRLTNAYRIAARNYLPLLRARPITILDSD